MKKYCPVCSNTVDNFLPGGVLKRQDVKCPICGTRERYRLLTLYLRNETDFFKKKYKVLEVCPEKGFSDLCKNSKNLDYISIDLYKDADLKMDITNLKFKEKTFDYIICYHVLEHILDEKKALRELIRVLKNDGVCLITCPVNLERKITLEDKNCIDPIKRKRIFGQDDHVRTYGTDLFDRLSEGGFSVKIFKYIKRFSKSEILKYGLKDEYNLLLYRTNEDVYICTPKHN